MTLKSIFSSRRLPDKEIVKFLTAGEGKLQEAAFRAIYRQHFSAIRQMVLSNSGSEDDAADVFQDGIIVLFRKVKQDDFVLTSTLQTYLYAICRNKWLMRLRKQNKEVLVHEEQDTLLSEDDLDQSLEWKEKKGLLMKIVGELDERCREILVLFYYRQFRMAQIQERMGFTSEQSAKNKKSQCLKGLRERVKSNIHYRQMFQ